MIIGRRLDRLVYSRPLDLKFISKIILQHNNNSLSSAFVRDYMPLILYGNLHIKFENLITPNKQLLQITQQDGLVRNLNLKLYLYPQQLLQRIVSLNS
ncbi:hypothetical protein TpMuguga_02g02280 [Theileria parva strain Muguga]|uniref:uncharacterized protein n=1 Tax=Theileria parva strain Muguga TaxID=333668 RepID=UPI001C6204EA|nr:uncharacterized protein TpMuguga_02g02280 [Theileria parva strain Muguga]KAF5153655.1 hypothetical protein TpMuguga_02g02280 [Theileria parva strain Muguga]